jgi:hypothetical protein
MKTRVEQRTWFGRSLWFVVVTHEDWLGPYETEAEAEHEELVRRISSCSAAQPSRGQQGDANG